MFVGREEELAYLNEWYQQKGSKILIVYGQKGIGKTTLLKKFLERKENCYYEAVSCSTKQQCVFLANHLKERGILVPEKAKLEELFCAIEANQQKKKLIVIDEFQNMCKEDNGFLEIIYSCCRDREENEDVSFICCTSSISWIENSVKNMVEKMSQSTESFYLIKEMRFKELQKYFPMFSLEDCIRTYGILGGVPGLWQYFDAQISLEENIQNSMLQKRGRLSDYGQQYVAEELRETAVYNTILSVMAAGKGKLNELYQATGFSRAKISVYLKHLIQLGLVEKIISIDTEGRENVKKGIYRICHSYIRFYYRYLFHHQNKLESMETGKLYEELIATDFNEFIQEGFRKYCVEFLEQENQLKRLPENFSYLGQWVGKKGNIDFIFQEEEEEILAGICNWKKEILMYEDYELFVECLESAKIDARYMILFSAGKFDNRLREAAKKNPYLALVSLEQMGER